MRVQIPVMGIRSPDGGNRHRGSFQSPLGLARLRHRGNFRPLRRSRFGSFFAQFSPRGIFQSAPGRERHRESFRSGQLVRRLAGRLSRLLDTIDTGGIFAPGDSKGSRARSVSRNFSKGSKARSIQTGGRAAQQGPQSKFLGGFCCLRA